MKNICKSIIIASLLIAICGCAHEDKRLKWKYSYKRPPAPFSWYSYDLPTTPLVVGNNCFWSDGYLPKKQIKLIAIDAESGKEKWTYDVGWHIEPHPGHLVSDGDALFFQSMGHIFAVDAGTGKERWEVEGWSPPALYEGNVYFGGGPDRKVYAVDGKTGKRVWEHPVDGWPHEPVLSNGKLFCAQSTGNIGIHDPESIAYAGRFVRFPTPTPVGPKSEGAQNSALPDKGNSALPKGYAIDNPRSIISIDLKTGTILSFSNPDIFTITGPLWVSDEMVYFTAWEKGRSPKAGLKGFQRLKYRAIYFLYALDAQTMQVKWKFDLITGPVWSMLVSDKIVYVGAGNKWAGNTRALLHAIDGVTGKELWRRDVGARVNSSPLLVNDTLYVVGHDNILNALDPLTGSLKWKLHLPTACCGGLAVSEDKKTLFITDKDLYAINIGN